MVSQSGTNNTTYITATETGPGRSSPLERTISNGAETATSPLRAAASHLHPAASPSTSPASHNRTGTAGATGGGPSSPSAHQQQHCEQQRQHEAQPRDASPQPSHPAAHPAHPPDPSRGAAPGAALFSVPPAAPPNKGVYVFPQEAFVISDLDTGRRFEVNKEFWIKDVDTGSVYVLDQQQAHSPQQRAGSGSTASHARSPSPIDDGEVLFTDLLSGQQLSVKEFESTMGYAKVASKESVHVPLTASQLAEIQPSGGKVEQMAQRRLIQISSAATASAAWVKGKTAAALSKVGSARREAPVTGYAPSFNFLTGTSTADAAAAAFQSGGHGSGFLGSGSVPDPNGIPVKVSVHRKSVREFADLRLVQEVQAHSGVVWAMKFSRNGRYLATAGQDGVIRVWEAVPNRGAGGGLSGSGTPLQPGTPTKGGAALVAAALNGAAAPESDAAAGVSTSSVASLSEFGGSPIGAATCPGVPVIRPRPYRTYRGHKQDVLDVSWSRTHFLLSASMDKTVRLWHVSVDECLRVFKHSDFVTAIDFHPTDDKLFISGSIDGKVRLWNVPDQRVMSWQDVHEMVTAVGYGRDAARAAVGTMRGKCRFYAAGERAGLEYEAALDVKNARGQHARGKKVTGVVYAPTAAGGGLLVTSNDSRIRLYDGYALRCKFKGHANRSTQIRASFSPRGEYVICGSDTGWVYIWNTRKPGTAAGPDSMATAGGVGATAPDGGSSSMPREDASPSPGGAKEKNSSYESFQATSDIATVAVFAPETSQRSSGIGGAGGGTAASGGAVGTPEGSVKAGRNGTAGGGTATPPRRSGSAVGGGAGQVILVAGYSGGIKIYENMATHPLLL